MSAGEKRKRVATLEPDLDEPKAKVRKVDLRGCNWFLTWNNYTSDSIGILLKLTGLKRYCVQEELSDSGTPHLQGVLVFKTNVLRSTLENAVDQKVHWEKARSLGACKSYCSKQKTRSGKQWIKGFHVQTPVLDPLEGKTLYKWQEEILDMVRGKPDDRKVYWYWSDSGNVGKSVLCKHMVLKEDAIVVGGAFRDAYYAIQQRVSKKMPVEIVVFALCRSQGNKVSYISIEGIKDGLFFSPKYESGMCVYNPPHVLVFANCAPDLSLLSADRWVVKCLDTHTYNFNVDKTRKTPVFIPGQYGQYGQE